MALEAQACGAAVLATDADGLRFAVENHRTGLLVAPALRSVGLRLLSVWRAPVSASFVARTPRRVPA